jgi:hypothetical protein
MKVTEVCRDVFQRLEDKGDGGKDFGIAFQHIFKEQGNESDKSLGDVSQAEYLRYPKK